MHEIIMNIMNGYFVKSKVTNSKILKYSNLKLEFNDPYQNIIMDHWSGINKFHLPKLKVKSRF